MSIRSDAQRRATNKYNAGHYDAVTVRMKKGERDAIHSHAAERGESLNAFINRAIAEAMERDKAIS